MKSYIRGGLAGFLLAFALQVTSAAELPMDANTICTVMTNKEANPDLFVDHKGEPIYLCCTQCKTRFVQNPEKYLARMNRPNVNTTATTGRPSPSSR